MSPATEPTPAEGTMPPDREAAEPRVGICVLDYLQPEATRNCIASLLAQEPASTRILWLENEAATSRQELEATLAQAPFPWAWVDPEVDPLPGPGVVGVVPIPENLGYAGGNNVGLRFFHRHGVPYAWVLNNDTLVLRGCSDNLVRAAEARPEVGAWGTPIITRHFPCYFGGIVSLKDFSIKLAKSPECLETEPLSYVSGCSLFIRTALAAELGYIPEHFFLYYEDPAFGLELRKAGYTLSGIWDVPIFHIESLSTGRRSRLMEFYSRRNRWHFIQQYFPEHLARQRQRLWYHLQKYFFRLSFKRVALEYAAYRNFRAGLVGRAPRDYSRQRPE